MNTNQILRKCRLFNPQTKVWHGRIQPAQMLMLINEGASFEAWNDKARRKWELEHLKTCVATGDSATRNYYFRLGKQLSGQ